MAQIPPIENGYIDDVIKSNAPYNPTLNQTQGVKLRELVKLLRDRLEQEIAENHQIFTAALEAKVDKEAGKGLSQENFTLAFKNKLEELALMGIPAGPVDTIGTPVSENSPKLFYNTTSHKLRIYDPVSMTWRDSIEADLTNYYTRVEVNALIAAIPNPQWGTITGSLSNQTDLNSALEGKLSLSGGEMIGQLKTILPVSNQDAANKQYVDNSSIMILDGTSVRDRRTSNVNTQASTFIGQNAGKNATSATYSNFFGAGAGSDATSANRSNFFGLNAGGNAAGAESSNFFGDNAGGNATNARFANMFGLKAGNGATSAEYSNLFGYMVGKSFTGNNISSNNIIIGKYISLPNGTSNAINLGGVLFGSYTNSATIGDPKTNPVEGGKIGVGILPTALSKKFEVNGSAGYTTHPESFTENDFITKNYVDNKSTLPDTDIEFQNISQGIILRSPDSSRWRITVGNDGVLTTTKL